MSISRVVGFILLGVGVVLIIIGVSASSSLADSLSTTFTGRMTQGTLQYLIAGGVSAFVGLLLAFGVVGRTRV